MLYKKEFGQNFNLGIELSELDFLIDKSWKQDMSPSFYFIVNNEYYVLWVDYENPEMREEDNYRYLIQMAINEGSVQEPEIYASGEIIFSCETSNDVKLFLLSLTNNQTQSSH